MPTTKASKSTPIDPQFMTRFHAALRLGRHPNTITRMEEQEGLPPIRVNGHILYRVADVDALAKRWEWQAQAQAERKKAIARNRETEPPPGWKLTGAAPIGMFFGEKAPTSVNLGPEGMDGPARVRNVVLAYELLSEAFAEAERIGCNVIKNVHEKVVAGKVK